MLFQYLPYIQQDALRLDAQDVEAVLEATCGGGGAAGGQSSIWGVMLWPCLLTAHANSTIDRCLATFARNSKHAEMNLSETESWNASLLAALSLGQQ